MESRIGRGQQPKEVEQEKVNLAGIVVSVVRIRGAQGSFLLETKVTLNGMPIIRKILFDVPALRNDAVKYAVNGRDINLKGTFEKSRYRSPERILSRNLSFHATEISPGDI